MVYISFVEGGFDLANLKINGVKKAEQVEPIKNSKDIKKIRQYLMGKQNKRDYCLWCCGTNFLLRAGTY